MYFKHSMTVCNITTYISRAQFAVKEFYRFSCAIGAKYNGEWRFKSYQHALVFPRSITPDACKYNGYSIVSFIIIK